MRSTISFRSARLGRRGLDEEHVRAFCRQVEAELVVLHSERSLLQEEVGRLRRRILGDPDAPAGAAPGGGPGSAVGILSRAQQTAEHYVAEAQEYSRYVTRDARRRRDGMVAGVRAHLDHVIEQAHHEACRAARTALAPGRDAGRHPRRPGRAGLPAHLRRRVHRTPAVVPGRPAA